MLKARKMCRNNLRLTATDAQMQFSFLERCNLTKQEGILMYRGGVTSMHIIKKDLRCPNHV